MGSNLGQLARMLGLQRGNFLLVFFRQLDERRLGELHPRAFHS